MSDKNNREVQIAFRVTPAIAERIEVVAAYHGRTKSHELRLAWSYFDTASTLAYLQTDAARAELGDGHADAVRRVKADLAELSKRAFTTPPSPVPNPEAAANLD